CTPLWLFSFSATSTVKPAKPRLQGMQRDRHKAGFLREQTYSFATNPMPLDDLWTLHEELVATLTAKLAERMRRLDSQLAMLNINRGSTKRSRRSALN